MAVKGESNVWQLREGLMYGSQGRVYVSDVRTFLPYLGAKWLKSCNLRSRNP